mgnify:FL=1
MKILFENIFFLSHLTSSGSKVAQVMNFTMFILGFPTTMLKISPQSNAFPNIGMHMFFINTKERVFPWPVFSKQAQAGYKTEIFDYQNVQFARPLSRVVYTAFQMVHMLPSLCSLTTGSKTSHMKNQTADTVGLSFWYIPAICTILSLVSELIRRGMPRPCLRS